MIVPFQMVMFTMSKMANVLRLDNPVGIIVIYLGFGAGLSVFIFSGFIKSIPLEIEEAARIDGCNPIQTFFLIVFPVLKPISITVAILNTMWIWNDYLLPYLVIGSNYRTILIAVHLQGGYAAKIRSHDECLFWHCTYYFLFSPRNTLFNVSELLKVNPRSGLS
jgi:raffinose/stachyose/melibiose transport system permease protein